VELGRILPNLLSAPPIFRMILALLQGDCRNWFKMARIPEERREKRKKKEKGNEEKNGQ